MKTDVTVGELDRSDIDQAVQLWQRCGLTRPWNDPQADAVRALDGPSSTILAARTGDARAGTEVVATAMVGTDGHRGWVHYVAVAEEHRRLGLGRQIMTAAEQWLADHGAPKVQLMVRSSNAAVVDFYAAQGYVDQECLVLGKFLDPKLQQLRNGG